MLDRFSYSDLNILGEPIPVSPDKRMGSFLLVPPSEDTFALNLDLLTLSKQLCNTDTATRMSIAQSLKNNSPRNIWPYLERALPCVYTIKPYQDPTGITIDSIFIDIVFPDVNGNIPITNPVYQVSKYLNEGYFFSCGHIATLFEKNIGIVLIGRNLEHAKKTRLKQVELLINTLLAHQLLPINADGIPIPKF